MLLMWLLFRGALSFSTTGEPAWLAGTSKLALKAAFRCPSATVVGLVWIGNLVSAGPLDLSRRWLRPLAWGAGLLARDFEAMARLRASMLARRLLSSVLKARMRGAEDAPPLEVWERVLARLSSPKMASLWAKRSRMRR